MVIAVLYGGDNDGDGHTDLKRPMIPSSSTTTATSNENNGNSHHGRRGRGRAAVGNNSNSKNNKAWTSNTPVVLSAVVLLVIVTFFNSIAQNRATIRNISNLVAISSVLTTTTTTTTAAAMTTLSVATEDDDKNLTTMGSTTINNAAAKMTTFSAATTTDDGNSTSSTNAPATIKIGNTTNSTTDKNTSDTILAVTTTSTDTSTVVVVEDTANITDTASTASFEPSISASFVADSHNNNNNSNSNSNSINAPRAVGSCFHERGKSGKWVLDWDYGNRSSYVVRGTYTDWHFASQSFRPTPQQPSRLAASYRWDDDICPVHEVTRDKFCHVCATLNVSKILILGDSLSAEFGMSLLSLLRQDFPVAFQPLFKRWHPVTCDSSDGTTSIVHFRLYRRSPLSDMLTLGDDLQLKSIITNSIDRTVIVANTGLWIPTFEEYKTAFGALLDYIDSFPPDKIIPFIRPTIPGHPNCQPRPDLDKAQHGEELKNFDWVNKTVDEVPFENIQAYRDSTNQQNESQTYNWLNLERYNDYSYGMLKNRTAATAATNNTTEIHWFGESPIVSVKLVGDGHLSASAASNFWMMLVQAKLESSNHSVATI